MTRAADTHRLVLFAFAAALLGLALWKTDELKAWARSWDWLKPTVQTFVQPARVNCTLPTEHEQMVVVFYWRDGRLAHRCMFAGSRGTYSRPHGANRL